jgi:hypothetical protein
MLGLMGEAWQVPALIFQTYSSIMLGLVQAENHVSMFLIAHRAQGRCGESGVQVSMHAV